MTDITDRITPQMSEEEVLGIILDEIMDRADPDVAEAIHFCAIPHWFDEEIIAWLRGEGREPSQRTREILAELTELTFVGPYHDRGYAHHENVRDLLLHRWRQENAERFQELSGVAAAYYADKLEVEELSEEQRAEWQREEMYHLLAADSEQGFELFGDMFNRARDFYQLSTCALLLQLAGEQESHLSTEDRLWLRYRQGRFAYTLAQWPEAQTIFEGLWTEELLPSLEGALANELGLLYTAKGEWDRATEYYERSLAIKEKAGDEHGMATIFNNLGLVYQDKGEWDRAIEYYQRSLVIAKRTGNEYVMSRNLNNLGSVYQDKGEWDKAIEYYQRSLAIRGKLGDEHGMATSFNNLGLVYKAKGEWDKAIEYFQRDLAICEKVGDEYGMSTTFNNLGSVYEAKGEWDEAIEYYQRSLAILEKVGDELGAATTMHNLALLYEDMERYDEAVELLEKVVKTHERVGHPELTRSREALERIRKKAGQ